MKQKKISNLNPFLTPQANKAKYQEVIEMSDRSDTQL